MAPQIQKNNILMQVAPNSLCENAYNFLSASYSFNQGDLLMIDTTNHVIRRLATEAEANHFAGIARVSVVSGKIALPYSTPVDASLGLAAVPGPVFGVIAQFQLAIGQTFNAGDAVYAGPALSNTTIQSSGTKAIGVYQGPTVTAGAATYGPAYIGARHPADTLTF